MTAAFGHLSSSSLSFFFPRSMSSLFFKYRLFIQTLNGQVLQWGSERHSTFQEEEKEEEEEAAIVDR